MKRISQQELLRVGNQSVAVTLRTNPRARRLIVKVHPSTGEVSIVAPSARSLPRAKDFARKEAEWIAARLAQVPEPVRLDPGAEVPFRGKDYVIRRAAGPREGGERGAVWIDREAPRPTLRVAGRAEHAARRVEDWLRSEARKELTRKTFMYAAEMRVTPARITVRDTASRWGSCSTKGGLSYSWRLIMAPSFVLNYVVAHEVAHLREMNHGPRFWRLVEQMTPDLADAQAWLHDNGPFLHRYGAKGGWAAGSGDAD